MTRRRVALVAKAGAAPFRLRLPKRAEHRQNLPVTTNDDQHSTEPKRPRKKIDWSVVGAKSDKQRARRSEQAVAQEDAPGEAAPEAAPAPARPPVPDAAGMAMARQFLNSPAPEPKPTVAIPGGRISFSASAESLFKVIGPQKILFYRGGVVVEIVTEKGRPAFRDIEPAAAQSRFEHFVQFVKSVRDANGANTEIPTTINKQTAETYMKSGECAKHLPHINGIAPCPLLIKRDGQPHLVDNGYDATTGIYVQSARPVQEPSLAEACARLKAVIADFDFVSPGDRSRALASLLTPALKLGGWITGPVPIDVAEANASQSGKSYRQQVTGAIYGQQLAVVTKKEGGVGSLEETLQDHLVKGRTFIQFDNMRGPFNSQFIEALVTAAGPVSARTPHRANVDIEPASHLLSLSSNGFQATKDMANRSSIIRIRKRVGHQYQVVSGKDLLQRCLEEHPVLLGSVFAIIREWHRCGCPRTTDTQHDLREWAQTNDWIVQNILKEDPLMQDHVDAQHRAANPNLSFARLLAVLVEQEKKLGTELTASELVELCQNHNQEIPGLGKQYQDDEKKTRPRMGTVMKSLFMDADFCRSEGYWITRIERTGKPENNWQTGKCYVFDRIQPGETTPPPRPVLPADDAQPAPGTPTCPKPPELTPLTPPK